MADYNGQTITLEPGLTLDIDIAGADGSAASTVYINVPVSYAISAVYVTVDAGQPTGTINVTLTDPKDPAAIVDLDGDNGGTTRVVRPAPALTDNAAAAIDGQYTSKLAARRNLTLAITGGNAATSAVQVTFDAVRAE